MEPFTAALLGGVVGGIAVALVESLLNRMNERNRWLREERQRRYAELAAAVEAIYHAQNALTDLWRLAAPATPDAADVTSAIAALRLRERDATRAEVLLSLLAPPHMVRKGESLVGEARSLTEWFDSRHPLALTWEEVRDSWRLQWEEIEEFVELARRDLGAGRDPRWAALMWYRRQRFRYRSWRSRRAKRDQA